MLEHSLLSPSSAHRWLACPASLEGHKVSESSAYAIEGAVAHSVAHECWMLGVAAKTFIGAKRICEGTEVEVTDEMAEAVQTYLDFIAEAADGSEVILEQRFEHPELKNFGGTIDCIIPDKRHLIDFKYGAGVAVEVKGQSGHGLWFGFNAQLGAYALLFNARFPSLGQIKTTVVQPRAHHVDGPIRSTVLTPDYLDMLFADIDGMAGRAGDLRAGHHCKWCPRAAQCPELYELTVRTAKAEFAISSMTPERAAEILNLREPLKEFFEAVEQWAHGQMDKGISVPGYKLVDRFGNRRWAFAEDQIAKKLRKFGKKQIYQTELLSPAQMEEVVGKELVSALVERPNLGTTLVPESDRREAVKRLTAADEFKDCLSKELL
jgi:hypothetical protein